MKKSIIVLLLSNLLLFMACITKKTTERPEKLIDSTAFAAGPQVINRKHHLYGELSELVNSTIAEIRTNIRDYFSSNKLLPYIKPGEGKIFIQGLEDNFVMNKNTVLAKIFCDIIQDGKNYKAVFHVYLDANDKRVISQKLLYIGNKTIETVLFYDLMAFLSKKVMTNTSEKERKSSTIYLKTSKPTPNGATKQVWTLFNGDSGKTIFEIPVTLLPDGKGGTYFMVE